MGMGMNVTAQEVSQDERARRREMVARMAEQRAQDRVGRGIGNLQRMLQKQGQSPQAGTFAAASPSSAGGAAGGSAPPAGGGLAAAEAAAEPEDEDAMLARAIALSLEQAAQGAGGGSAAGAGAVFGRLAAGGRGAGVAIDLDDSD